MTEETTTQTTAENTSEAIATSTPATEAATAAAAGGEQQQGTEGQASTTEQSTETKTEGAPEAYEFKAPEGREFDPEVVGQFSEVAKELNLTQDAAQKMLDKMAPALAARQENAIAAARAQWVADTKADSEIGGAELAQKVALANTTFEKFGTPELRTLLDESGLGDHPEMLRWAHRVGKAMSEDGFVAGRGNANDQATPQNLYSASNMNP
jgi:hypothetical protein